MAKQQKKAPVEEVESEMIPLNKVLVELQKTFSRVVRDTRKHQREHPNLELAVMRNGIDFNIELNAVALAGEVTDDKENSAVSLYYSPKGDMTISFQGKIDPDFEGDLY